MKTTKIKMFLLTKYNYLVYEFVDITIPPPPPLPSPSQPVRAPGLPLPTSPGKYLSIMIIYRHTRIGYANEISYLNRAV